MAGASQRLSIVIPVLNEQDNLRETYQVLSAILNKLSVDYEVIMVDNGSGDNTPAMMQELCQQDSRWKCVRLSRNFGYQSSISAGMLAALGDAILVIDADLQDPPELIAEFVAKWRQGYDIVYGVRQRRTGEPFWRTVPTMLALRLISWMSDDVKLPVHSSDFRLITRRVRDAFALLPENSRFVRGMIHWLGFKQIGIPYTRRGRSKGVSKSNPFILVGLTIDAILSFSARPVRFFSFLGMFVIGLTAVLACMSFFSSFTGEVSISAITLLLLLNLGVLSFGIGALGEYLARILKEAKRRPLWLVDYTINFSHEEWSDVRKRHASFASCPDLAGTLPAAGVRSYADTESVTRTA